MSMPILATKLYAPPPGPSIIPRPRLLERLDEGLERKLTIISAPAGFGKTVLLSGWIAARKRPTAWLSLDEADNDPARFLTYLIAALQTIMPEIGAGLLGILQSPQPPATELILTTLLNDLAGLPDNLGLVLDDYHLIDAQPVERAVTFLLDHLPARMHLIIATRQDPQLPLARLRAKSQLAELRVTDLRFSITEADAFLNRVMDLHLSGEDTAALETRTEGWIAGLQLAAISMRGHANAPGFIKSFTGSHHFVMDYLVEEVLQQQSLSVQAFLLRTSILDRLCGPLCDAVLGERPGTSRETLEYIEHANLFLVPLDNERRWYRYHHLFADLLLQRLGQAMVAAEGENGLDELHMRASQWFEDNGLDIEAFQHAAAAHNIERAERLSEGKGIPLHYRGAVAIILDWLGSLPVAILNARPSLWWRYASLLLVNGQTIGVEEKLRAAEVGLQNAAPDDHTRNLIGRIAVARATLALTRYDPATMIAESRRALEYLNPANRSPRANAHWTLGVAYLFQGDRKAARQPLMDAVALSQAAGDVFTGILATIGLGNLDEADNLLYQAAETYQRVLDLAGEQPLQIINEAHLGLARVLYAWNELDAAEQHGMQSLRLARQYEKGIDRFIICEVFLARVKLARGDVTGAAEILAQSSQTARQQNFVHRLPEVAEAQVLTLLAQGNAVAAAQLVEKHQLPFGQARVLLAQGQPAPALAVLQTLRQQVEAKDWQDQRLNVMILQALAYQASGETDRAIEALREALALAQPGGGIRVFVDEGQPMARLLAQAAAQGTMRDYVGKLLAAFEAEQGSPTTAAPGRTLPPQPLIEPLSQRELEVLRLIADGFSNREIGERLFLALSTIKGHTRQIFGKLQVQRRTEAVARARELGLL